MEVGFDYYTAIAFPIYDIIPAYTKHYTLSVKIVPDRILENNELFRVTVQPELRPIGYYYCSAEVIIQDDDGNFNITIVLTLYSYGRCLQEFIMVRRVSNCN